MKRSGWELAVCVILIAGLASLSPTPKLPAAAGSEGARPTVSASPQTLLFMPTGRWGLDGLTVEGVGIGMTLAQVHAILGASPDPVLDEQGTGSGLWHASRAQGDPFDTVLVRFKRGRVTSVSGERLSVGGFLRIWSGQPMERLPIPGRPARPHQHGYDFPDRDHELLAWRTRDALIQVYYNRYSKTVSSIELCGYPEQKAP